MKNKILLALIFTASFGVNVLAQSFKGTIVAGSAPNSVMLKIRPNATLSGQITNLQFTVQIPNTVSPQPTASIRSNPLSANVPTLNYLTQVTNEGGFYTYLFAATTVGSPVFNFTNGVEVNALEIQFGSGPAATSSVRFAHLPDGGSTFQLAFYVEVAGNDLTDYPAPFYGPGAVNGGSPTGSAYSFVPIAGIALPVKFTAFSATKKDNDALLTWTVENEIPTTARYEVERSIDGNTFDKIATLARDNSNNTSKTYNTIDPNLSSTKKSGLIYYRIKQLDLDGRVVYSDIKFVRMAENGGISIFPNPAQDFTNLSIDATNAGLVVVDLVNADGKQFSTTSMQVQKGTNIKRIPTNNLPAGTYLMRIKIENEIQVIKLTKL